MWLNMAHCVQRNNTIAASHISSCSLQSMQTCCLIPWGSQIANCKSTTVAYDTSYLFVLACSYTIHRTICRLSLLNRHIRLQIVDGKKLQVCLINYASQRPHRWQVTLGMLHGDRELLLVVFTSSSVRNLGEDHSGTVIRRPYLHFTVSYLGI